jgi:hypothetical protein
MYVSTAKLSMTKEALKQYLQFNNHPLLNDANLELEKAIDLMENHYRVKYSIIWVESKSSTKKRIIGEIDRIAFDAYTAILKTGEMLNGYIDATDSNPPNLTVWLKIIEYLSKASWSMQKENYPEIYRKQLTLF